MSYNRPCYHCGSLDIDIDSTRNDAVCRNCSSVLEESIIVSEVQFTQESSGAYRALGHHVSNDSGLSGGYGLNCFPGKSSRDLTIYNANRRIANLCNRLGLNDNQTTMAQGFYKMALKKKLTHGRRNIISAAACVYMVCRIENTHHMLLDISDAVQVNVYDLGKVYMKLATALCINVPVVDPALYVLRFAHSLEFKDKCQEVVSTATRLVHRMKKDWIHTGRRPSGLCGAALIFAARLHNYNRTVNDIIKVVKVCQATVRKRLSEFASTPSGRLTLDEFLSIDLEEEQDPPAFKATRKRKLLELEDEAKFQQARDEIMTLQKEIDDALEGSRKKQFASYMKYLKGDTALNENENNEDDMQEILELCGDNPFDEFFTTNDSDNQNVIGNLAGTPFEKQYSKMLKTKIKKAEESKEVEDDEPQILSITGRALLNQTADDKEKVENIELDISGIDDAEIDSYIMADSEIMGKTMYWFQANSDYIKEQKEKNERALKEEMENPGKAEKKHRKRKPRGPIQAKSPEEAIGKVLKQKKISLKLDYSVLKNLESNDADTVGDSSLGVESTVQKQSKKMRKDKSKEYVNPIPSSIRESMSELVGNNI